MRRSWEEKWSTKSDVDGCLSLFTSFANRLHGCPLRMAAHSGGGVKGGQQSELGGEGRGGGQLRPSGEQRGSERPHLPILVDQRPVDSGVQVLHTRLVEEALIFRHRRTQAHGLKERKRGSTFCEGRVGGGLTLWIGVC